MCNITRRRALAAAALLAAGLASACTPTYNWREMPAADGAINVAFPARPKTETRELPMGGHTAPFTLTAASVNDAIFAVGHVVLPPHLDATGREAYRAALEDSLARNLQATARERRDVQIRHAGHGARAPVPAHELEFSGAPNDEPSWLLARVVLAGDRLIEVAAIGPRRALSDETARTFIDSVRMQ